MILATSIFQIWTERYTELIFKLNLHKSKNQILYRNFNWLLILLGFMYSNVPIERGLAEAKLHQYLEHLFKEKCAGSWKPQEKK